MPFANNFNGSLTFEFGKCISHLHNLKFHRGVLESEVSLYFCEKLAVFSFNL